MNRFIISNNQKYDLVFYTLHLIVKLNDKSAWFLPEET